MHSLNTPWKGKSPMESTLAIFTDRLLDGGRSDAHQSANTSILHKGWTRRWMYHAVGLDPIMRNALELSFDTPPQRDRRIAALG